MKLIQVGTPVQFFEEDEEGKMTGPFCGLVTVVHSENSVAVRIFYETGGPMWHSNVPFLEDGITVQEKMKRFCARIPT